MPEHTPEQLASRLKAHLEADSPEEIISGLAALVLAKDGLPVGTYRTILSTMVGALYLKVAHEAPAWRKQ